MKIRVQTGFGGDPDRDPNVITSYADFFSFSTKKHIRHIDIWLQAKCFSLKTGSYGNG